MGNSASYHDFYRSLDDAEDFDRPGCRTAEPEDDNLRLMLCPTCGSEGVLIYAFRNDPENERYETCPHCEGACVVLIEVEPIELEDLP